MDSTEISVGLSESSRTSSRVLKPPGGGHSNIFAEPELSVNAPRPKYNQQNSSNVNACMGSTDPNQVVEKLRVEIEHSKHRPGDDNNQATAARPTPKEAVVASNGEATSNNDVARNRVPPGGYSSGGFW